MKPDRRIQLFLRVAAWATIPVLAALSLIPKPLEIRTGLAHTTEHAIAYGLVGALFALAYPTSRWRIAVALFALSGLLELLQNFVAGRQPLFVGAAYSGAGAACGVIIVSLVISAFRRFTQKTAA